MHGAISRNRDRFRLHPIASRYFLDVRFSRRRNERALFSAQRATGLDEIFAAARAVDGPRETVHGILAPRDPPLFNLRARRATRTGRRDLGELLFARHRDRVL